MALRLYLSPTEQAGGFAGIPRATQVFNSSLGFPSNAGNYMDSGGIWRFFCLPGAGRNLPVFPFTTTKPGVGERTTISINQAQSLVTRPAGGTTYYSLHTPACIGAMEITSALTVNPNDWMPVSGGTGQWSFQFRNENWLGGVLYEAALSLTPAVAYIWRPSTATMVGVLWDTLAQQAPAANGCWGVTNSNSYETSADWSTKWVYARAGNNVWRGAYNIAPWWNSGTYTAWASVAVQAGDVMCVEYWFFSWRANVSFGSGNRFSMSIGGGTDAGMTTTFNRNAPTENDGTSPIHNTFIDLPSLSPATFPTDVPSPAYGPPANLIAVDPGVGPHLSLTFDNSVGIIGPTIGPASDGLGVTGATAISTTQIDLACAIRPDHPDGDADNATLIPPIGEADPLGPPVPTGVGAVQI